MKGSNNRENVLTDFFLFSSTISYKKWHKDKFETYQHTCNFSNKIFPLLYYRHIKSGLKCFLGERGGGGGGVLLVVRLVPYQTLYLKMLAIIVIIKEMLILLTKIFLSSESERNKAKIVCWSDQQIQVFKKNVKRVSKVLKSSKHHNIWVQIKEKLNIQFLLFKYLIFCLIYTSFSFRCQILHSFFIFSFVLNIILRLSRIFESVKYHL